MSYFHKYASILKKNFLMWVYNEYLFNVPDYMTRLCQRLPTIASLTDSYSTNMYKKYWILCKIKIYTMEFS